VVSELITKGVISEVEIALNEFFEYFYCGRSLEATGNTNIVVFRRRLNFDWIDYLVFTANNQSDGDGAEVSIDIGGTTEWSDNDIAHDERIETTIDCRTKSGDQEVQILCGDGSTIAAFLQNISLFKYDEAV
jgi:hypothetical protein